MSISVIATRWRGLAPYLLSTLKITAAFLFMQFGTTKWFAFPASILPDGGTVPLASLLGYRRSRLFGIIAAIAVACSSSPHAAVTADVRCPSHAWAQTRSTNQNREEGSSVMAHQRLEQAARATQSPTTAALFEVKHISVSISRSSSEVYAFISDGENLAQWASGLGGTYQRTGEEWLVRGPLGTVKVRLAKKNDFGVADQDVTLDTGVTIHNPIRVVPNGTGSTVVFTLMRLAGVSAQKFNDDANWVDKDLTTLKRLLERR